MNNLWIYLSCLTMISTSITLIVLKLLNNTKHSIGILLSLGYIFSAILGIIYICINKKDISYTSLHLSPYIILLVFLFPLLHILSQIFMSNAINLSPNISYCHLIVNLNIIITLIASYFLFKQKLNYMTFIGILISLIGVSIVIKYSNE